MIRETAGKGADLWFSLKTTSGRTVVFKDQRKYFLGVDAELPVIESLVSNALSGLNFLPENSVVIPCLFNCTVSPDLWENQLPINCVALTMRDMKTYHGTFNSNPAAVPFVDLNNAPLVYTRMLLDGRKEEEEDVTKAIASRRYFKDLNELEIFIKRVSEKVSLKHDVRNIIHFTNKES